VLTLDLPALAVALSRRLHAAGVPATPERAARFAEALTLLAPVDGPRVYWAARVTFVSSHEQLPAFDRVMAEVLGGDRDFADTRGDSAAPPAPAAAGGPPAEGSGGEALDAEGRPGGPVIAAIDAAAGPAQGPRREAVLTMASSAERLGERSFAALTAEELAELRQLARGLAVARPVRRARRTRRASSGEHVDVRATLRRSRRTSGEPVRLERRRRRRRPRRLVFLCDVSGSMEPYTRASLQLLQAAAGGAEAEVFVFATRLTRLTRALRGGDPDAALARAAALPPDWSGGTRIAEALRVFIDRHGRRGMARGAVVVILSDGWERGEPAALGHEMERLARLAHRIVWVNPRKAAPGFAPLTGGMAAALPFCDAFLSGHNLSEFAAVLDAVGDSPTARRTTR